MLAPASDTIRSPRGENANPNGTAPAEAVTIGVPGRPKRSGNVSIRFAPRTVTISERPSGVADDLRGAGRARGQRGRAAGTEVAGAVDVERGHVRSRAAGVEHVHAAAVDVDRVREHAAGGHAGRPASGARGAPTRNDEMSFEPALTATRTRPSSLSATAPWSRGWRRYRCRRCGTRDRRKRTVRSAIEPVDGVARRRVRLGVNGAGAVRHRGTAEQQCEADRERGEERHLHWGASWGVGACRRP